MNLLFFGDSITMGSWDSQGGYVSRIYQKLIKQINERGEYGDPSKLSDVYNLGVDGADTKYTIDRFDKECQHRVRNRDYVIVFALGINDTIYVHGSEFVSTPEEYGRNIKKLYDMAKQYVDRVLFMNITPFDDDVVQPTIFDPGVSYYSERADLFNNILQNFCDSCDATLIDVHTPFAAARAGQNLLCDGLHPNDAGHELIADVVIEKLEEILQ